MKRLFITLKDRAGNEIYCDYLCNIDACKSYTIFYKFPFNESDVMRIPFELEYVTILSGVVRLNYANGLQAEIIRK